MCAREARRQDAGVEVERLKRELAAVQQRLEEEVAYYRAQTETTRQRVQGEQLRVHAQEVARRREVEDELARTQSELRQVREQAERLRRRHEELDRQYQLLEASARLNAEEQVAQTRIAARDAWQSAEEELAAMEAELSEARRGLAQEQERSRQLEETLGSMQSLEGAGEEDRQAALLGEVTALKKALNLSERGRQQAHKRAVSLAEKLVTMQAEPQVPNRPAFSRGRTGHSGGTSNPVQVDLSEANAVLSGAQASSAAESGNTAEADAWAGSPFAFDADLADEFRLIQADTSLDRHKLERLQQQVEAEDRRQAEEHRRHVAASRPKPAVVAEAELQQARLGSTGASAPVPRQPRVQERRSRQAVVRRRSRWPAVAALLTVLGALGAGSAWYLGVMS